VHAKGGYADDNFAGGRRLGGADLDPDLEMAVALECEGLER
jgi:hypothetical protein